MNLWDQYVRDMIAHFNGMTRDEKESLIVRACQVGTMGCAIVLTCFFYQFIPNLIRIFALPAFIIGSWFVASTVVGPIVIRQFDSQLNGMPWIKSPSLVSLLMNVRITGIKSWAVIGISLVIASVVGGVFYGFTHNGSENHVAGHQWPSV